MIVWGGWNWDSPKLHTGEKIRSAISGSHAYTNGPTPAIQVHGSETGLEPTPDERYAVWGAYNDGFTSFVRTGGRYWHKPVPPQITLTSRL